MRTKDLKRKLERIPVVTITLIGINVLVFLILDVLSISDHLYFIDPYYSLISYGSLGYDRVLNHHEFYRLITHMFLHGDEGHLFNNMLMLATLGYYMEEYLGHIRFGILYFCSGLIAAVTSMVYNMMQMDLTPSIGASGAIFGLMGGFVFMIWHQRQQQVEIDPRRLLLAVAISFYGGISSQGIDMAAHAGGFLSGIPFAALLNLTRYRKGRNTK